MPQLPLTIRIVSGPDSLMSSKADRMSGAPTPQLAPTAIGCCGRSAVTPWMSLGCRPIIVLPAVSKDAVKA